MIAPQSKKVDELWAKLQKAITDSMGVSSADMPSLAYIVGDIQSYGAIQILKEAYHVVTKLRYPLQSEGISLSQGSAAEVLWNAMATATKGLRPLAQRVADSHKHGVYALPPQGTKLYINFPDKTAKCQWHQAVVVREGDVRKGRNTSNKTLMLLIAGPLKGMFLSPMYLRTMFRELAKQNGIQFTGLDSRRTKCNYLDYVLWDPGEEKVPLSVITPIKETARSMLSGMQYDVSYSPTLLGTHRIKDALEPDKEIYKVSELDKCPSVVKDIYEYRGVSKALKVAGWVCKTGEAEFTIKPDRHDTAEPLEDSQDLVGKEIQPQPPQPRKKRKKAVHPDQPDLPIQEQEEPCILKAPDIPRDITSLLEEIIPVFRKTIEALQFAYETAEIKPFPERNTKPSQEDIKDKFVHDLNLIRYTKGSNCIFGSPDNIKFFMTVTSLLKEISTIIEAFKKRHHDIGADVGTTWANPPEDYLKKCPFYNELMVTVLTARVGKVPSDPFSSPELLFDAAVMAHDSDTPL